MGTKIGRKYQMSSSVISRINVVGTSGCGKSTFSKKLANIIGAPHLEMDKIYWGPNWSSLTDEEFFDKLKHKLSAEKWVLDGNYQRTQPIKWENVQMVIWLDYPFWIIIARAIKRSVARAISGVELWEGTGNRETFRLLFSKDSIVLWTLQTLKSNRMRYNKDMTDKSYAHIEFVRLSKPEQAQKFLEQLQQNKSQPA